MSDIEQITSGGIYELQEFSIEQNNSNNNNNNNTNNNKSIEKINIINKLLKIIFSTPGLVVLVVIYSIMGALIFPLLEAPRQTKSNIITSKSREECLRELWTITEKLNVLYEKNWTMLVHEQLKRFEDSIIVATRNGINGMEYDRTTKWTFSEALLYSVTVITTIGHGNLTPKTSGGKIVTIFYALIGVPLMLMCLSSLGSVLAEILEYSYIKLFSITSKSENEINSSINVSHNCQSHKNSKICKYDVNCETKFHNNSEYTSVNQQEDSRHLLQNSPKLNHNSPYMQLKNHHNNQNCLKSDTVKYNQINKCSHLQHSSPLHHQYIQSQPNSPQHCQIGHSALRNQTNNLRLQCTTATAVGSGCPSGITLTGQYDGANNLLLTNDGGTTTTTTTVYFPLGPSNINNLTTCNSPIHHYDQQQPQQQPIVKYHTIRLQNRGNLENQLPMGGLHGVKRGKYIAKAIPQEINVLLPKTDLTYNNEHDDMSSINANQKIHNQNVDIMEDDEETELNHINCPHGTPSRIPLLQSTITTTSGRNILSEIENENSDSGNINERTNNIDVITNSNNINDINDGYVNQVPMFIVLFILSSYILLGTVIFAFWENWSFIDGAYFCFITLSTIGYTDIIPLNTFHGPEVQLFACCAYLLLGLVLVAMSFNILETQLMWKCKKIAVRLKLTKD